jgi:hypothetical protein
MGWRIELTRSGGLAGVATHAALDSTELAPAEAARVEGHLDAVDLDALAATRPATGPPDTFRYRLKVDRGGRTHEVELGESQVPDGLRPLIAHLSSRAHPGSSPTDG